MTMPKMSDDTLLRHAIPAAILDRESLAEAYDGVGEAADRARELAAAFEALKGRKLTQLTNAEAESARLCFIYAEQYEQSRADARVESGTRWAQDPKRRAESFKEVRMRRWGRTQMEADIANAGTVNVTDLLKR